MHDPSAATCMHWQDGRFSKCSYSAFCAEVMGSQSLWSIVEGLASRGCSGIEEDTLLHCRGQIQQDVHQTADEAQLREGYTISLAKPGFTQRSLFIVSVCNVNRRGNIPIFTLKRCPSGSMCACARIMSYHEVS